MNVWVLMKNLMIKLKIRTTSVLRVQIEFILSMKQNFFPSIGMITKRCRLNNSNFSKNQLKIFLLSYPMKLK